MTTIATFNVNSIRSRLPAVLAWLEQNQPDALALQETKVRDEEFPVAAFRNAGWQVTFRGEKAYNGVAIVSRDTPQSTAFGFDDGGPADDTRLMRVCLGPLTLINTYVPQGRQIDHPMYRYKLEWFARLRRYFERHLEAEAPAVWLGDLNVAPTDIDVHHPETKRNHVCFHADVRNAFREAADWGFEDLFRLHDPAPGHYSFFDYRQPRSLERNHGWRIDLVMGTPTAARCCRAAGIDQAPRRGDRPSDHTPVWVKLDLDVK